MNTDVISSVLAATQAPTLEVRDDAGELIGRVDRTGASGAHRAGMGKSDRRAQREVSEASRKSTLEPLANSWRGGRKTTQPIRADSSCKTCGPGQLMGNSKLLREHQSN
jgi:hypothetical protein